MLEKERRGDYLGKTVQVIRKNKLIYYVDYLFKKERERDEDLLKFLGGVL